MIATRSFAAFLATLVLPVAAVLAGVNRGVPVNNGNKVEGAIDPAGDEDCFLVDLSKGGDISLKVAAAKGESLLPAVFLKKPDGTVVSVANFVKGEGTSKVSVKKALTDETGEWAVCVKGLQNTTGTYTIQFKSKTPNKSKIKGDTIPTGAFKDYEATGDDGSLLTFVVKEKDGAPVDGVQLLDPAGVEVAAAPPLTVRKGTKLSAKNVPLAQGFGTYKVRVLGAAAGSSVVDVQVKVKLPKPEKLTRLLGPEPRPASATPPTGRDGDAVVLGGTGFVAGARAFFDQVEATGVTVDSDAQITCTAPQSAQSDAGAVVPITVLNPDGQENTLANAFLFKGIPAPASLSPSGSPLAGGITLTINGSQFRAGSTVTVGGTPATGVVVNGTNQITCTLPAHAAGPVQVVVTDEFGRSGPALSGLTYYAPPQVTAANPSTFPTHAGVRVNLTGSDFRAGVEVRVDGILQAGITIGGGGTALGFDAAESDPGTYDLQVTDEFGQSNSYPGLITRTRSFHARPSAIPAAPSGTDFFGSTLGAGDMDNDGDTDFVIATPTVTGSSGSWLLTNSGSWSFADVTATKHATFSDPGDSGQASVALLGDLDGSAGDEILLTLQTPLASPYYFFYYNGRYYAYYIYYNGYISDYRTYTATRFLSNNGSGSFSNATSSKMPSSTSAPYFGYGERYQGAAAALGDLDGDNVSDLVLAGYPAVVQAYAYVGYAYYGYYFLQEYKYYIPALRTLTNDGTGKFTNALSVPGPYYMNGTYSAYPKETFEGSAVAVGDLDGDGASDIVVSRSVPRYTYYYNYSTYYSYYYLQTATRILTNDGTGTAFSFDPARMPVAHGYLNPYSYDYWQADTIALGDLDGDGKREILLGRDVARYWYDYLDYAVKLAPAIRIFSNNGTGYFTENTTGFLPSSSVVGGGPDTILSARSIRIGDLDGDASPDLVVTGIVYYVYDYAGTGYGYYGLVASGYVPGTRILLNDGYGSFSDATAAWMPPPVNGDYFVGTTSHLGDLDGDGDLDLVISADFYPNSYYMTVGNNRPLRVFENK